MNQQKQYLYAVLKFSGIGSENFDDFLGEIEYLTIRKVMDNQIYFDCPIADENGNGNLNKLIDSISTDVGHLGYKASIAVIHGHQIMEYSFSTRLIDF